MQAVLLGIPFSSSLLARKPSCTQLVRPTPSHLFMQPSSSVSSFFFFFFLRFLFTLTSQSRWPPSRVGVYLMCLPNVELFFLPTATPFLPWRDPLECFVQSKTESPWVWFSHLLIKVDWLIDWFIDLLIDILYYALPVTLGALRGHFKIKNKQTKKSIVAVLQRMEY